MDLQLKQRRVLVAGSSSGIGRACAELFAREGADLFLVARSGEKLQEAAATLSRTYGVRAGFATADLSTPAGVDTAFAAAEQFLGGVDILVNNAGGPKPGLFATLTDDDWHRAVELNLMNTVRLTRRAIDGMRERRWGRIVNITSISVKQPIEGLMLSNSVRMAVVGFAKTLANEVGPFGITVNTVGPGYTSTDRLTELADATAEREGSSRDAVFSRWAAEVPLRRIGEPHEIAAAIVFLASEAASYISGAFLPADGGRVKAAL